MRCVTWFGPAKSATLNLANLPHVRDCTLDDLADDAPHVVVLIDDLTDIVSDLARLLIYSHEVGFHFHVVASGSVSSAGFGTLITGKGEPGDFEVRTAAGETVRFQAAYIAPAEIPQVVAQLSGQHQAAVLAG